MSLILSIQGCMASGKTSALHYIAGHLPDVTVFYEDNREVIEQTAREGLIKTQPEDYLKIQRLWIAHEMERYRSAGQHRCSVLDFGPEEIEFYTLNYPQTVGADWDVENSLHRELADLRQCRSDRILFLDADKATLLSRKNGDANRSRLFFEHYTESLMPLKKKWFSGKDNVDILQTDDLSKEQVGQYAVNWIRHFLK